PERAFAEAHDFVKDLPPRGTPFEQFLRLFLEAIMTEGAGTQAAREQLVRTLTVRAVAEDFRFVIWAILASAFLGDIDTARELTSRAVASARATGSFNALTQALTGLARISLLLRDFDQAEECAREGIELTQQFGQENQETCCAAILVRCLAIRGQIEECR